MAGQDDSFEHHGIKGQKWGVRRFQNEDNSALNKALSPLHPLGRMAYKAYMKEILDNNASIAHSQLIGGEDMVYNDTFEHHGIKGQKWGVRRTRQQLGYKIKNSKALGMYGGDRKKNREALKDMRTRMDNNKEGLNKVKSLDRASTVQHVLGNMFGGGVGIALHTASVADRKRARDAYTDVRSKAYEETKQKYGEDAANRALRHQKKVEQRVKVALGAAIVADTIFVTADINRTMNGGRSHV